MGVTRNVIVLLLSAAINLPHPVLGHARLWVPPSRSSMWRWGYQTPINYQDNELFCGGLSHQVSLGYKCGVCGDPFDGRRENEAGGKYATGIVTRTYGQGQGVSFQVDVTANHKGYLEFKICPTNDPKVKETQDCFDRYPLSLRDGSGTKYYIPSNNGIMTVNLTLPFDLICDFCVVQLRYHAGNSWGTSPDGASCVGCGPQEEFYGCADIKIVAASNQQTVELSSTTYRPSSTLTNTSRKPDKKLPEDSDGKNTLNNFSTDVYSRTFESPNGSRDNGSFSQGGSQTSKEGTKSSGNSAGNNVFNNTVANGDEMICRGVRGQSNLDEWCQLNCQSGYCPSSHCACSKGRYPHDTQRPEGCRAAGGYHNVPGLDIWCRQNCAAGNCPSSHCVC